MKVNLSSNDDNVNKQFWMYMCVLNENFSLLCYIADKDIYFQH